MNIIDKIDEVLKLKPSFEQWLNNKKNYKKIKKVFLKYYEELANDVGQNVLDEYYYDEDNDEYILEDPIEAYENNAHNMGYQVEYEAAMKTIKNFKKEFNYQRGDEDDDEKQYKLAEKIGYKPSFR